MPDAELRAADLLTKIPDFLHRLAVMDTADPAAIDEALAAAGLRDATPDDVPPGGRYRYVRIAVAESEDVEAIERKLRNAISRKVGKASGKDKHWDVGGREVSMRCRGDVNLSLTAQLSMTALRRAAVDWLGGAELQPWLVKHGFVDAGAQRADDGTWPTSDEGPTRAQIRSDEDGHTRISFFMEPGVRPPGSTADGDDERYAQTLAFLGEELGEAWPEGWWHAGSRSFVIHRQRSYARSILISEAPEGRVAGPGLGGLVTIDRTPEPDPREAIAHVRELAEVRGLPLEDAHARLVTAGVVTQAPPRQLAGMVALADPHGRDVELALLDGCVARSIIQVAADSKDLHERLSAAFNEAFGESPVWKWPVGELEATFSRTGDKGFERLRAVIAEPTVEASRTAQAWLLEGEPLPTITVRDRWHGRCVGEAISAGVVPALTAGAPIWRVDDRLLWLENGELVGADRAEWPTWGADIAEGGTSAPVPGAELAAFAEQLVGWEVPTPEDLRRAVVDLGWATGDPDSVTIADNGEIRVRLRRPAGGVLGALVREDGTVRSWTLTVAYGATPEVTAQAREELETVLEPYRDPERKQGWRFGTFAVKQDQGARPPSIYLKGTASRPT